MRCWRMHQLRLRRLGTDRICSSWEDHGRGAADVGPRSRAASADAAGVDAAAAVVVAAAAAVGECHCVDESHLRSQNMTATEDP